MSAAAAWPGRARALAPVVLAVAVATAVLALPAGANARVLVGIADQAPASFAEPEFQSPDLRSKVRRTRYIVAWNAVLVNPNGIRDWMQAVRAARLEPMIALNHSDGDACPAQPCKLPSVREYTRAFRALRREYPDIRVIQPWNEGNHQSQPTAKNPRRAAEYYNVVRRYCRGCKIVAADVLDSGNMERWLATFKRYAKKPRIWGLHNYSDTNRFRSSGTERLLRAVRGEVWITETGGVHEFTTVDGRAVFAPDERRAAKALRHAFRIAVTYPDRIKRLYVYQWKKTNPQDRFDAGLVSPEGVPRRALAELKKLLRKDPPRLPRRVPRERGR